MGRNQLLAAKNLRRLFIFIIAVFSVASIAGGLMPRSAHAENPKGIQVKPLRKYETLDPGTTSRGELSLKNTTNTPQNITMSTELFSVSGLDYNYSFRDDKEVEWITFSSKNLTLQPNETKLVSYDLAVPADASPGGHYFSLLTTIDPPKNETGVKEIRRVASLLYLEVSGKIIRSSQLTGFSLPWITTSRTIPADVYLSNGGNSHVRARVLIDGRSFSSRVARQPKGQFAVIQGTILPATLRKLSQDIQLPSRPGFYRMSAQYSPPEGGTYHRDRILFYIPFWFIPLLTLFIIGISYTTARFILSQRKRRKIRKNLPKD